MIVLHKIEAKIETEENRVWLSPIFLENEVRDRFAVVFLKIGGFWKVRLKESEMNWH